MSTLFDEAFLRKLEYLYIVSRKVFVGRARAERRTRKLGSGLEFADHRDYAAGDDPRYLDWNVVGRMDRLLVRLFEEEEDLYVYLLVDTSRSMTVAGSAGSGTPPPFDHARRVAAALAYIALANLDRVSIVPFAGTLFDAMPPTRGKRQIHKVLRFLEGLSPDGATSMANAFDAFAARTRHAGLAVVLSDFFDPAGFETGIRHLQSSRFEVFAVHVHPTAPSARSGLPGGRPTEGLLGERRLIDAETGQSRAVTLTPATLRRYEAAFAAFQERLARFCLSRGIGFVRAPVDVPLEEAILRVFRQGGFLR
jgi:uncharacterized protein (DUF58 family)